MATRATSAVKSVGRKPHFIATFVPNSSSDRLEIPYKFHQHIEGRTNVWVLLSGRGGKVWRVGLLKLHDTLFFNEGWAGFVKDSFVEIGDILVFEYSGDWQFEVYIFDENGCEKEVSDCVGNLGPSLWKKRVRDGDKFSGRVVKKKGSDACISNADCMNHEQEDFLATPCQPEAPVTEPLELIIYQEPRSSSLLLLNGHPTYPHDTTSPSLREFESAPPDEPVVSLLFFNSNHIVGFAQKHKKSNINRHRKGSTVIQNGPKAADTSPTIPSFITKMQKYNVDFGRVLNIPMQFIRENSLSYLTDEKMVLCTETGSSWSVNIVANTGGYKLCGGWSAFVIDNGIKKGDICEFKLMSRLEIWVQVTPNPKVASRTSRNGHLSCPPRNAEVKLRTVKPELEHVIQNALKAADASSIRPSFLTKMQKYNVEYGRILNIPMHFVREHSLIYCTGEKMVLHSETGSSWSVNIVANMGGYKLCGGWSAFVSDNGIKKGDICEFKLMSRLEMRVEVTPNSKSAGEESRKGSG